jgi:hypothetical protein
VRAGQCKVDPTPDNDATRNLILSTFATSTEHIGLHHITRWHLVFARADSNIGKPLNNFAFCNLDMLMWNGKEFSYADFENKVMDAIRWASGESASQGLAELKKDQLPVRSETDPGPEKCLPIHKGASAPTSTSFVGIKRIWDSIVAIVRRPTQTVCHEYSHSYVPVHATTTVHLLPWRPRSHATEIGIITLIQIDAPGCQLGRNARVRHAQQQSFGNEVQFECDTIRRHGNSFRSETIRVPISYVQVRLHLCDDYVADVAGVILLPFAPSNMCSEVKLLCADFQIGCASRSEVLYARWEVLYFGTYISLLCIALCLPEKAMLSIAAISLVVLVFCICLVIFTNLPLSEF